MKKNDLSVGLFYASETGHTKQSAFELEEILKDTPLSLTGDPKDIADVDVDQILSYDFSILGSPTWNIGELQVDLGEIFDDFDRQDWSGKMVAVYGYGDQEGYPDTYQDALGLVAKKLMGRGATLLGRTATKGHVFTKSLAVEDDFFLGLPLDEENQAHLTTQRLKMWAEQLTREVKAHRESGESSQI